MVGRIPKQPSIAKMANNATRQMKTISEQAQRSAGIAPGPGGTGIDNPALQALLVSTVEAVVAKDAFVKLGTLSTQELAGLKVKVASTTARALQGLSLHAVAEKAATGLRHAEIIRNQQAKVIAQISGTEPARLPPIDPKELAADLASVFDSGAKIGSLLAHDLWYADALPRTVQGAKSDDMGAALSDGTKVRARAFMAPSAVILESGDAKLIKSMEGLNITGVQAALLGAVDAAAGTWALGAQPAEHAAAAKALPDLVAQAKPSGQLGEGSRAFLQQLGREIVVADQAFARGTEPDWTKIPLAHGALRGNHQRWLQLLSYEPGESQKVDYDRLSFGDKKNTVSSVIAFVFGAMKAGGMIPDELVPGVPVYLEQSAAMNEAVSMRLDLLDGKPAAVLRDSRNSTAGGAQWTLRVDGKEMAPLSVASGDGAKVAALFLSPGSVVEVVDQRSGVARSFFVPPTVFDQVDPAEVRRQGLKQLQKLEGAFARNESRGILAEAQGLIAELARDNDIGSAKALASLAPHILAQLPLTLLGADKDRIAYADNDGKLAQITVTPANAKDALAQIKQLDATLQGDSVELRRAVLSRSGGTLSTSDAYIRASDVAPKAKWDYLDALEHWTDPRRVLQETLYARAWAEATGLNELINPNSKESVVICMRGNTAAGKTTAFMTDESLQDLAAFMKNNPTAAVNPDPLKEEIARAEKQAGVSVSSSQVHEEGSAISWRLSQALQKASMSMVVDRRLGSPNDVSDIVASAEANGKKVELIDVEAPLAFSLMGVLMRKPGGTNPIVPFGAIAYGFVEVREGRLAVIDRIMNSDAVRRYDLFATNPDGSKVCVARKRDKQLEILDTALFDAAVGVPQTEVESWRTRKIDAAAIKELTGALPGGFQKAASEALAQYQGMTFEEALDAHGKRTG